nr:DNA-directed DNA polymerase [Tanacetum cinerariifolium]
PWVSLVYCVPKKGGFTVVKNEKNELIPTRLVTSWRFFPPSKTTNLRNEITRFQQRFDESFSEAWDCFNDLLRACLHYGFSELHQLDTFYNALNVNDHDSLNSAVGGNFLDKMPYDCFKIIERKSKVRQSRAKAVVAKVNSNSSTPAISFDVAKLKDMVRALLLDKKNQSSAPAPSSTPAPVKAVVKQGTKVTKDQVQTPSSQSTAHVQPPVTQSKTPVSEPFAAPVIKVGLFHFPADFVVVDFKPDPRVSLILRSDFLLFEEVNAFLGLEDDPDSPKLDPSYYDPEGNIQMLEAILNTDFVVVDFEPDPRVPLILERCFLKTSCALIDVHKGELTLRIRNEAITYNLDQTSRYSANYDQMTANKIDVTDEACEEYFQEVLGFSNVTASGSPTPSDDPIVSTTSPTLTTFRDSDFLLFEEANAFLDPFYYDPKGDIQILEAILNSDLAPSLPNHEQSVPSFTNELKACEAETIKNSIDEPPEVELKDLPPHIEYEFLEGDNKLPVIIAKELGEEEKAALIKVLKSHKQAIAWKLSDIQ